MRLIRAAGAVGACVFFALVGSAPAAPSVRHCRRLVVRPGGAVAFWTIDAITTRGVSCRAAASLVRAWDLRMQRHQIPRRFWLVTRRHVVVYNRFAAPYRLGRFTCRWKNLSPGRSVIVPGEGRCTRPGAVVDWHYHGSFKRPRAHVAWVQPF